MILSMMNATLATTSTMNATLAYAQEGEMMEMERRYDDDYAFKSIKRRNEFEWNN